MGVRALVIGGGNMAQAIVRGAIDAGVTRPEEWAVADPNEASRAVFAEWGTGVGEDASEMLGSLDEDVELWWAVKPQVFEKVAPGFGGANGLGGRVVVSIMAGVTTSAMRRHLGEGVRAVRVMPNTPVRVRRGVSAIALGEGATEADASFATSVFGGIGEVVALEEGLIDAFTGVAGSGPGYLFLVAEAMVRGAVGAGIEADVADTIVRGLFLGAGELLSQSELSPEQLRKAVTSPGGTTAAGLDALQSGGVPEAFVNAVLAARDRGRELGGG